MNPFIQYYVKSILDKYMDFSDDTLKDYTDQLEYSLQLSESNTMKLFEQYIKEGCAPPDC